MISFVDNYNKNTLRRRLYDIAKVSISVSIIIIRNWLHHKTRKLDTLRLKGDADWKRKRRSGFISFDERVASFIKGACDLHKAQSREELITIAKIYMRFNRKNKTEPRPPANENPKTNNYDRHFCRETTRIWLREGDIMQVTA